MPPLVNVNVKIFNNAGTQQLNMTSPNIGLTNSIGATVLCSNNGTQPDNSFYIDGDGYVNQLLTIDSIYSGAGIVGGGNIPPYRVGISGITQPDGYSFSLDIWISDTLPGIYNFNTGNWDYAEIIVGNRMYDSNYLGGNFTLNILDWSHVGGQAKFEFGGTLIADTIYNGGTQVNISNGKFNALRY